MSESEIWAQWKGRAGPATAETIDTHRVLGFLEAIGSAATFYRDDEAAARAGFPCRPAPLTFPVALHPAPPEGLTMPVQGWLHGEQRFTYVRPLWVGETVTVQTRLDDVRERRLGGQRAVYLTWVTTVADRAGVPVVEARALVLRREGTGPQDGGEEPEGSRPPTPDGTLAPVTAQFEIPDLRRYGEAAGDFNAIHWDPAAAQAAGLSGPVVQGMLAMALVGRWLEPLLAQGWWTRRFQARFRRPALAGEELVVRGTVEPGEGARRAEAVVAVGSSTVAAARAELVLVDARAGARP